eukprot:964445_1
MAQEQKDKGKPDQCDACMKPFTPDPVTNKFQWLVVENFKLHPDCFRCRKCNNQIDQNSKYHKKDDGSFICIGCTQGTYGDKAQLVDQKNAGNVINVKRKLVVIGYKMLKVIHIIMIVLPVKLVTKI